MYRISWVPSGADDDAPLLLKECGTPDVTPPTVPAALLPNWRFELMVGVEGTGGNGGGGKSENAG